MSVPTFCRGIKPDGTQCHNRPCRGDTLCAPHGGHSHGKRPACTCPAFQWPHRFGSGGCRWPDPPAYVCDTPAGTHDRERRNANRWRKKLGFKSFPPGHYLI